MMTAYGPIRFNEKGVYIGKSMAVVQIRDGKPLVVTIRRPLPSRS